MGLFEFLPPKPEQSGTFSGGSGSSIDDAVVINNLPSFMGVRAEYSYVRQQCGRKDEDWTIVGQALIEGPGGKYYDVLTVKMKDGMIREFYFDISSFYGTF